MILWAGSLGSSVAGPLGLAHVATACHLTTRRGLGGSQGHPPSHARQWLAISGGAIGPLYLESHFLGGWPRPLCHFGLEVPSKQKQRQRVQGEGLLPEVADRHFHLVLWVKASHRAPRFEGVELEVPSVCLEQRQCTAEGLASRGVHPLGASP